jgi:hypothetical protein
MQKSDQILLSEIIRREEMARSFKEHVSDGGKSLISVGGIGNTPSLSSSIKDAVSKLLPP